MTTKEKEHDHAEADEKAQAQRAESAHRAQAHADAARKEADEAQAHADSLRAKAHNDGDRKDAERAQALADTKRKEAERLQALATEAGGQPHAEGVIGPVQLAASPATLFGTEMTLLVGNRGGNVQQLLASTVHGRQYCAIGNIPLAAQASGSVIAAARLPVPYTMVGILALSSVSLGTSTIAVGSPSDTANAGFWAPAATLTVTTPTMLGVAASLGVPILVGYDCLTGEATGYQPGHQGGGLYDDIIVTTGVAALPGAGNLRLFFEYMI